MIERDPDGNPVAETLDAGEQNCATLVLSVRKAINTLEPEQILAVVAYDPSAQLDLRAWSRMTGHRFLSMEQHDTHATIFIKKKGTTFGEHADQRKQR